MAILNHGSTLRTADGGQTTTTIVTAANIGTYGVATNSTYYVGTTQNVFNRASGAQTLTGVSIDGNAATVTNGVYTTGAQTIGGTKTFSDVLTFNANVDMGTSTGSKLPGHFYTNTYDGTNVYFHIGTSSSTNKILNLRVFDSANNYATYIFNSAGTVSAPGDFRAPIFYDSNDTAYYLDPASNSRLLNLGLGNVTPDLRLSVSGDAQLSGILYLGGTAGSYNSWGSRTYTTSGVLYNNSSSVEFNNYGYGSTWTFTLGGGNATSSGAFRAPVFYDSDNTAYYLDAANSGTSLLVAGKVGIGTTSPSAKLEIAGFSTGAGLKLNYGNSSGTIEAVNFIANGASNGVIGMQMVSAGVGDLWLGGSGGRILTLYRDGNVGIGTTSPSLISGYVGLNVVNAGYTQIKLQSSASSAGIEFKPSSGNNWELQANTSSQWFVFDRTQDVYRLLINSSGNVGIGTASPSQKLDVSGAINASTYVYAGVFYDNDNTVYYTNPSGTSNLVGLTVANTITGSVSGSSASCTGNAATASLATTSDRLTSRDNRTISPSQDDASKLRFGFTSYANNNTSSYADYLHLRSYADSSGGNDNLIMFNKSVIGMRIWQQAFGSATAYATYKDVAFTDQAFYIGTTSVAINRSSASQTLTGVSIDGNAATVTNGLTTSNYVSYSAFTGAISSGGAITATSYIYTSTYLQTGGNLIYPSGYGSTQRLEVGNSANNNWIDGLTIAPGGTVTAPDNMRSPIFYDSNDTAYYGDFASTSKQYQAILFGDSSRYSAVSATINGTGAGDKLILYGNASNYDARVLVGADYDFIFKSQGSPSSKGMFRFYSGNSATLALEISATQNTTSTGDFRAPIFYDSNNTAYYLDPASTSNLYYIVMPHIGNGSPNLVVNNSASENWNAIKINGGNDNNGIGFSNTSHSAFARNNLSFHTHNLDSIRFHSSGWDTLFEVAGSSGNAWLKGGSFDSSFTRLVNPGGAYYVTGTSTITGAIKIRLPRLKVDTMMRMTVKIYQYNTGQSATIECGGYDYSGDGIWRNIFAYQNSDLFATVNVRFGNDGTYDCVWIGETSSTWSYPQVFVTDFQAGYNNYTSAWGTGWNISYVTAFDTVTDTRVAYKTLNASNYNSYSPTLTGTGASGTWSINVTGNASGTAASISGFNNPTTAATANTIVYRDGSGHITGNYIFGSYLNSTDDVSTGTITNIVAKFGDNYHRSATAAKVATFISGQTMNIAGSSTSCTGNAASATTAAACTGNSATTTLATKATRANGNFYIDDNYGNTVVGVYSATRLQGVFAMGDSYKLTADGTGVGTLYGLAWSHPNFGGVAANLADHGLLILQNGVFKGAWGGGSLRTPGDVRGTLFYDWDNTGYYCDPASTSNLYAITAASNITAAQYYTGGWFRNNASGNGLYNEATGQHFYSDSANYWNVASSASAQGIRLRTGGHAGTVRGYFYADTNNDVGFLNQDGNWRLRVVGGDYSLADGSSMRAQLFYDSNNTGYYVDPASTSNLAGLTVANTITGSITGSAGSVAWTNVSGRPTAVSSFSNDSGYITSGGSISGSSGSCTGNAASVTDGVYLSTNQSISGVKTFSSPPVATNIAKAWVHYNMNNNTINASYNVSSVTDNGTGVCTVNFSTSMVDANYVVAGTATYGYDDQDIYAMILAVPRRSTAQQAGSCRLATEFIHAAQVYDCVAVRAVFYR